MATTILRIRADRIVARNLADYKNGPIPAVSPAKMHEEIRGGVFCSRRLLAPGFIDGSRRQKTGTTSCRVDNRDVDGSSSRR